ncbi:alpha/beta fold hydrolase [Streptomyces murinus]|uniref:alpha/beta fold hydrolase n=1 Tax=Streptomyces murinus TaxID=33900 RepID=UPI0021142EB2|nr:alpha/beta hydrolase [Streptomyces murinus]
MPPYLSYTDKGPQTSHRAPLLLLHGHPFDRTMWDPQVARFSAERRVISPDLRGYGASPVTPGTVPFARHADDLAELLDFLGVDACVLAGLSMGGQLAMECWERFGDRIRGLVLADTFATPETPEGKRDRRAMADRLLAEGMRGYADEVLERMVAPYADARVKAHVHGMMTATPPEGAAASLRGRAERPDYRPVLTRVSVPALIVVGADDTYTPVSDAEALGAAVPDSVVEVVEGAAHLPNLERPEEFNRALHAFLLRVDGTA